jgi:hypothetical protein
MPGTTVATTSGGPPSTQGAPRTQYVYLTNVQSSNGPSQGPVSGGGSSGRFSNRVQRTSGVLGRGAQQASVPRGVPKFLGNQRTVIYCWVAAMGIIAVDEWHTNKILPRPARLWWTSLFFGLLCMAGMVPSIIPIVNAIAIGYLIVLAYQFYGKKGQFAS